MERLLEDFAKKGSESGVGIARVDLVFAHELSAGGKRLFFLVTDVVRSPQAVDEFLEVPRLRVVGLPAVNS
jgi:hypothetical protein